LINITHFVSGFLDADSEMAYTVVDMFMRKHAIQEVKVTWDGEKLRLAEDAEWEGTVRLN